VERFCFVLGKRPTDKKRHLLGASRAERLRGRIHSGQVSVGRFLAPRMTPMGSFIFHITAALAELERSIIRERTRAGLASARARGRKGGRPKKLGNREWRAIRTLVDARELTIVEIASQYDVSPATIYRRLPKPRWTRSPGPSGYGLHRLITALGHCTVVAPGDRGMTLMSSCLILILCGRLHRPNVFQDASKIRLRREAHGSISVQEGQPRIFPNMPRIFGFGNCWNSHGISVG
jgi:Resolvase, N terminal domain/Helix-turn-helix domain of resolvase